MSTIRVVGLAMSIDRRAPDLQPLSRAIWLNRKRNKIPKNLRILFSYLIFLHAAAKIDLIEDASRESWVSFRGNPRL